MKTFNKLIIGACAFLMTAASLAHHSYAPYEIDSPPVDVAGLVKSWRFIAPHPKMLLEDAEGVEWDIEVPIMFWRNAGYPEDAIKVGDEIVVRGFKARNGSAKMALAGFETGGTYYAVHENIRQRTAVEAAERIAAGEDLETVLKDYPEPEPGTFGQGMGMGGMGGMAGMAGMAAPVEAEAEAETETEND